MNEPGLYHTTDPRVPYEAEEERAERLRGPLADARPFVAALLTPAEADRLASKPQGQPVRWRRRCPCCRPAVAYVTITRKAGRWKVQHPAPFCPEYARYSEST